jgi:Protein of unknown function (DUF1349)
MLLCVAAAFAAPAPVYKPKSSRVWFTGWDKPVDPTGGCRFLREGGVLTIAVRGKPPATEDGAKNPDPPRLLRDVAGDFDMVVRVGGDFDQAGLAGKVGERARRAGVRVAVGRTTLEVGISALSGVRGPTLLFRGDLPDGGWMRGERPGGLRGWRAYFRVSRRGGVVEIHRSEDGREWTREGVLEVGPTREVKVGVFAEATAGGTFEAVFDQFSLTPLK